MGGPQSEIEAAARKKLVNEKEIKVILENKQSTPKELRQLKNKIRELLDFYDRIIRSIDITIKSIKSDNRLSYEQKQDRYLKQQEKEMSQAKSEKSKFRRYLHQVEDKISTIET